MGNLMIDTRGISGVLDWELAHIGDPAQDLAYLCTPSWRFGRYEMTVGGFGDLPTLLKVYRDKSGRNLGEKDVKFWMIYSSLWWALVCYSMTEIWRKGHDRSLERVVIGRRVSECLIDVLLMLEDVSNLSAPQLDWRLPEDVKPAAGPSSAEILIAITQWNSDDVIPNLNGRDLFQARIARNAMGILEREAQLGPIFEQQHNDRLRGLELDHSALCIGLSDGTLRLTEPDILTHLRLACLEAVSIDQPKYAGLSAARNKWTSSYV